jgi:hypothetical protein
LWYKKYANQDYCSNASLYYQAESKLIYNQAIQYVKEHYSPNKLKLNLDYLSRRVCMRMINYLIPFSLEKLVDDKNLSPIPVKLPSKEEVLIEMKAENKRFIETLNEKTFKDLFITKNPFFSKGILLVNKEVYLYENHEKYKTNCKILDLLGLDDDVSYCIIEVKYGDINYNRLKEQVINYPIRLREKLKVEDKDKIRMIVIAPLLTI